MNIALSWNLFVLAFFSIIMAYSLIIGRNQTLKIIICTYVAILTADGVSNLLSRVAPQFISLVFPGTDLLSAGLILKIVVFVGAIVLLSLKGKFQVAMDEEPSRLIAFALNILFGFLSATLLMSTILEYISGGSFLQASVSGSNAAIESIKRSSTLINNLIVNKNLWFSAPAIVFALSSFLKK